MELLYLELIFEFGGSGKSDRKYNEKKTQKTKRKWCHY